MRRKAEDRLRIFPDLPTSPCPGEDYFWDGDNQKWVYIEDDMDMSWILDSLLGKDVNPDKRVKDTNDGNSGRRWKEMMREEIEGKNWKDQKNILKKKVFGI